MTYKVSSGTLNLCSLTHSRAGCLSFFVSVILGLKLPTASGYKYIQYTSGYLKYLFVLFLLYMKSRIRTIRTFVLLYDVHLYLRLSSTGLSPAKYSFEPDWGQRDNGGLRDCPQWGPGQKQRLWSGDKVPFKSRTGFILQTSKWWSKLPHFR